MHEQDMLALDWGGSEGASVAGVPSEWLAILPFSTSPDFEALEAEVGRCRKTDRVYPPPSQIYRALELTPPGRVRVVILGQDPYHGPGQAHGLAFSVPNGMKMPPSLRNVFKEIDDDVYRGVPQSRGTDLTPWAEQGVLLLNTSLTVLAGKPGSHSRLGWTRLTDEIVSALSRTRDHLVFLLWGSHAQRKAELVDRDRHLVLESVHPSPLSAHRGFFGCHHFSQANAYLELHDIEPIRW